MKDDIILSAGARTPFGDFGKAPARGAAAPDARACGAGLLQEGSALGAVRACGTGSQAIVNAAQQIMSGHGQIAVAAGGENYSRAPWLSAEGR